MLKRIVLLEENEESRQTLSQALGTRDGLEVSALAPGDELPSGTAAVVGGAGSAEALLQAALQMGQGTEDLLILIASALDCREGFLEGSSVRVMEHATRFADALGLSPDDRMTLEQGALIRDIGKIRVPNSILLKEEVLSYDDWALIQQHPHLGADIVSEMGLLKGTADILRDHHECYDGDGYPRGIEGDDIPYLARIMKILDVYCAMTSPRHYREGHASHEEAVEYLLSEKGKHFDAELLDVFISKEVGKVD